MFGKIVDALAPVKAIARGTADRDALAGQLMAELKAGYVDWLEVGVGDGANASFLLRHLSNGRRFSVDLIDPQTTQPNLLLDFEYRFVPIGFEDFNPDRSYDLINCRQSAYYFWDNYRTALKLASMLKPGGIVAMTVWTENCVLFEIHERIAHSFGVPPSEVTHQQLYENLTRYGFAQIDSAITSGVLDVSEQVSLSTAVGLFDLCARRIDVRNIAPADKVEAVASFFAAQQVKRGRENGVALYRRL